VVWWLCVCVELCEPGTFNAAEGQEECTSCGDLTTGLEGATQQTECVCEAGAWSLPVGF